METISPKILEKVSSDPAFRKKWGLLLNFRFATAPLICFDAKSGGSRRAGGSAGGIKTALALDKEKPPRRIECGFANHILGTERFIFEMKNSKDVDSLSHTTWRCQYHVVFAPKYRRMVIYGQIKKDIGQILRKLCEQKDIEIIEAEACPDHIHMLISFSPKYSISYVMGYLKGKSSLMIFDRHANLKYKYGNRHFWARGYFVDTVGKNKKKIQEYIKNQLQQDQIADQLSLKEFVDPFTGSKETKA